MNIELQIILWYIGAVIIQNPVGVGQSELCVWRCKNKSTFFIVLRIKVPICIP